MIDALYRSLGSLRAWVTFIIGAVAATATLRSPRRANAAAPLGAASSSSLSHRKHTLPLLALLAAAALGLALLLPGGALQAQDSTIEYAENGEEPVATFTADDPEGATSIVWSIAGASGAPALPSDIAATENADSASFTIDEDGVLEFSSPPDFENPATTNATNNTYKVVVAASDGTVGATGTQTGFHEVTVKVTNVAETGKVTWTVAPDGTNVQPAAQFQVGAVLTATATDGDISGATKTVPAAAIWRWYRSSDKASMGTLITTTPSSTNTYTVGLADVGMYIRVVAHYLVPGNVDQETAVLTSDYPVLAARVGSDDLEFDPATVSRSVAEGKKGANVGAPVTATGNHGAINYAITTNAQVGGVDAFKIDAKTGQITTLVDLNYDGASPSCPSNSCAITVAATDASGQTTATTAAVTITITNVDEKPTFPATALTAVTLPENRTDLFHASDAGFSVTTADGVTYTATDPEARFVTHSLTGPDAARFQLSGAQVLSFRAKPDYENPGDANRDNVYEVTVRASDSTLYADRMVKVTVIGEDEAPAVMGSDSVNYPENGENPVATFTANDPEGATSIVWSIAGASGAPALPSDIAATENADSASFTIDEDGVLEFSSPPDFENPATTNATNNTYKVVVAASDGTVGATGTETGFHEVTVKVTNVAETGKVTWTVAPDGTNVQPAAQFQVGAVLTATAEDGDIAGATKTFTANVAGVTDVTWRWFRGSTPITTTPVSTNTYTATLADVGQRLRAEVTYQVGGSTIQERVSMSSVYPVLAARVGSDDLEFDPATVSRSVAEGKKGANVGAPVTATGNHGAINYAITTNAQVGGVDAFKIDAKTGQITTLVDLNYDGASPSCPSNSCAITVAATDASGQTTATTAAVTITITNVDEKPTFITDSTGPPAAASPEIITLPENRTDLFHASDAGFSVTTAVGVTYGATDEDGLNVNLSLTGPDAARFSLSATGVLSFAKKPDYENPGDANRDNVYEVTVRASDGTLYADRMVRVTVENVNEVPGIIAGGLVVTGPANPSVVENTPATTAVATYTAAGPDAASATWRLSGTDAADFMLSNSGVLSFRTSPNFENPADANGDNVYEVTVTADDGTNNVPKDVTVTVTDVEEQGTGDALVDRYDANTNGAIEKGEVIAAINDYLDDGANAPTKPDVIRLINLYLDS